MFSYTDIAWLRGRTYYRGDKTAAVEALIRSGPNVKYVPNNAYADAKLIIAWWVAGAGKSSYPPAWPYTPSRPVPRPLPRFRDKLVWPLKYLFIPIANLIPGMNQTPETAARRYLQASESSEPTSQGNSSPRLKGSSQAQLRRSATHTSTIAPARKLRGRRSSRSLGSISLPHRL